MAKRKCPICGTVNSKRTSSRGFLEKNIFSVFCLRPHRCLRCRNRFYWFSWKDSAAKASRVKKRKRNVLAKEAFSQSFGADGDEGFNNLIAELRKSEEKLFSESVDSSDLEKAED